MGDTLAIVFMTVVVPTWIVFHYITKWKTSKGLTSEDERILQDLWESARRMETRINTLETILDEERPGWRKKV
jgi:phage shock protein B